MEPLNPQAKTIDMQWVMKTLFFITIAATGFLLMVLSTFYWIFSKDLPQIITVDDYRPAGVTRIYTLPTQPNAVGDVVGEFSSKEKRYVIPFDKMPQILVQAFLAAEDDQFFEHPGINLTSIIRAGIANFRAGHTVQGGSTITQQVVKSLLLTPEKSYSRKIKEIILSNRLEKNLTKQQILYLYLNQIYLGNGAYGVQAGSQTYFRKDVGDLSIAEAALLAGLPQAPTKYSPVVDSKKAKERQTYVLKRMVENKFISNDQMTQAVQEPIKIYNEAENINLKTAPYYVEHIRRYLIEKFGEKAIYEDGLTVLIPTTKDNLLAARKSLVEGVIEVDQRIGYRGVKKKIKPNQVDEYQLQLTSKFIDKTLGFKILRTDGMLDQLESVRISKLSSEYELLKEGEVYEAIVLSVDDKKKIAQVSLGPIKAELSLEQLKWARYIKGVEKYQSVPLPSSLSQIFKKNDVIDVRLLKKGDPVTGSGFVFNLYQSPEVQGALFSLEVQTGHVLAMEGGFDYSKSEFNRAAQAQRQPGSAFKPLIYTAALEKGFTPATIIVDSPIVYEDEESGKWKPNNFEEKFYGDTTFRQALIKSRNVPTIKLVQALQVSSIISFAKRLGLNAQYPQDLSISLGSSTVSLYDLTRFYTLFPRYGRKVDPIFISRVIDRDGKILEEKLPPAFPSEGKVIKSDILAAGSPTPGATPGQPNTQNTELDSVHQNQNLNLPKPSVPITLPQYPPSDDTDQILDPRVAYVMTNLMKEVVDFGTGQKAKNLGRVAAGKTGTTNDYIDAWFMGFTPSVSTGVWVGFDNLVTMSAGETGARAALPIWLNYMIKVVEKYPNEEFKAPEGVVFATIDPVSGKLLPPNAPQAIKEAFIEGTEPTQAAVHKPGTPGGVEQSSEDFYKEDL